MLKISSSIEYATRVMVHMALSRDGGSLSAESLAEASHVPRDFVDQILLRLRRAGLVTSRRGARGGYQLSRPPAQITVGSVIRAVDEGVFEPVCDRYAEGAVDCGRTDGCGIRPVWARLGDLAESFLDRVTLAELCAPEPSVQTRVARLFDAAPGR